MARSVAASFLALLGLWTLGSLPSFCGIQGSVRNVNRGDLACNGWRLDKMEVGPGGIGQLVVAEGFFIGEKDMYKVLNKQAPKFC